MNLAGLAISPPEDYRAHAATPIARRQRALRSVSLQPPGRLEGVAVNAVVRTGLPGIAELPNRGGGETAFRFVQQDDIGALYWLDGPLGYALLATMNKRALMPLARNVYDQLNP